MCVCGVGGLLNFNKGVNEVLTFVTLQDLFSSGEVTYRNSEMGEGETDSDRRAKLKYQVV